MTGHDPIPLPPPVITARAVSYAPAEIIPWEQSEGNWLRRWWDTVIMAMVQPSAFFAAVRNGRRVDRAIWFFCIMLAIDTVVAPLTSGLVEGSILHSAWNRLSGSLPNMTGFDGINADGELDLSRVLPNGLPPGMTGHTGEDSPSGPIDTQALTTAMSALGKIIKVLSAGLNIVFGFVSLFATAALFQAAAWIFIPSRRAFRDTLRTVAYAHAPLIWSMVPLVGGLVFFVWLSVLIILGLRVVHGTTRGRVVAALSFWPTVILLTVGLSCALVARQALSGLNI
jgi:hypothetical protein